MTTAQEHNGIGKRFDRLCLPAGSRGVLIGTSSLLGVRPISGQDIADNHCSGYPRKRFIFSGRGLDAPILQARSLAAGGKSQFRQGTGRFEPGWGHPTLFSIRTGGGNSDLVGDRGGPGFS